MLKDNFNLNKCTNLRGIIIHLITCYIVVVFVLWEFNCLASYIFFVIQFQIQNYFIIKTKQVKIQIL